MNIWDGTGPGKTEGSTRAPNNTDHIETIRQIQETQTETNLKVPYSGAEANVDLGANELKVGDSTNYFHIKDDGEFNLHGTAKVTKRIHIPLSIFKFPVSFPPGEGEVDGFPTLDFEGTTKHEQVFEIFYGPFGWSAGTGALMSIEFFVDTAPATTESVVWQLEFKSIVGDGVFDFSGASNLTDTVALSTGASNNKKIHTATFTIPSTDLIAGGVLLLRVHRDPAHGSDDFLGDARAIRAHIDYTADKLGAPT